MARRLVTERALLLSFGVGFLVVGVYLTLRVTGIDSAFARQRLGIAILVSVLLGIVFVLTGLGRGGE
ncbi:hypothetical protein [Haladaptatus sp. NG-WS-4]